MLSSSSPGLEARLDHSVLQQQQRQRAKSPRAVTERRRRGKGSLTVSLMLISCFTSDWKRTGSDWVRNNETFRRSHRDTIDASWVQFSVCVCTCTSLSQCICMIHSVISSIYICIVSLSHTHSFLSCHYLLCCTKPPRKGPANHRARSAQLKAA